MQFKYPGEIIDRFKVFYLIEWKRGRTVLECLGGSPVNEPLSMKHLEGLQDQGILEANHLNLSLLQDLQGILDTANHVQPDEPNHPFYRTGAFVASLGPNLNKVCRTYGIAL